MGMGVRRAWPRFAVLLMLCWLLASSVCMAQDSPLESAMFSGTPVPARLLNGRRLMLGDCSIEAPSGEWTWLQHALPGLPFDGTYYCVRDDHRAVFIVALAHQRLGSLAEIDVRKSLQVAATALAGTGLKLQNVQMQSAPVPFADNSFHYKLELVSARSHEPLLGEGYYGAGRRVVLHLLCLTTDAAALDTFGRFMATLEVPAGTGEVGMVGVLVLYLAVALLVWVAASVYNRAYPGGFRPVLNGPLLGLVMVFIVLGLRLASRARLPDAARFFADDARREVLWALLPVVLLGVLAWFFHEAAREWEPGAPAVAASESVVAPTPDEEPAPEAEPPD
jgi:hypothetical protein